MTDEKLIDALAKITCAIEGRTHGFALDEVVAPGIERWMRHRYEAEILLRDIRDAGYVFEKAHTPTGHAKESDTSTERVKNGADSSHVTPTDDEREEAREAMNSTPASFDPSEPRWQLADVIIRTVESVNGPGPWMQDSFFLADAILAAGFRRSAVPEPSAEVLSDWFISSHGVAVASVKPLTDRGPSVMVDGRVISPNDVAALIEFKAQGEASDARFRGITDEVIAEAERSIAKHGEQGDLPMGTGPETYPLATDGPAMFDTLPAEDLAEIATADTKYHSRNEGGNDTCTWWHILREEVFEAAAESDPSALRAELVQVATVAVKMIDALDAAGGVQ